MKEYRLKISCVLLFIFFCLFSVHSAINPLPVLLYSAAVFLTLFFTGSRKFCLIALLQFFNYFWIKFFFNELTAAVFFIAVLSVLPLLGFFYLNKIKNKAYLRIYPFIALILIISGAEILIRETPLDNFLNIKERIASLDIRLETRSNYLVNNDNNKFFLDAVGRKFSTAKGSNLRVICLGSSSTEGHGAGADSYPVRMEEYLKARFDNIEVINAGAGGIRFYNLYVYYRDILAKLNPDLVMVYFGYNNDSYDIYNYFENAKRMKAEYHFITNSLDLEYASNFRFCSVGLLKAYRALFSSRLFTLVKLTMNNLFARGRAKPLSEKEEKSFKRENLRLFTDYCFSRKTKVVLVPEIIMYDNKEYFELFGDSLDESRGIYFFEPDRKPIERYLTDSVHFTKEGYALLAAQIGDYIMYKDLLNLKK